MDEINQLRNEIKWYRKWLENAGFLIKRLEVFPKDMAFKNRDELAGWVASVWHPYTEKVPESIRPEFINEFVTHFVRAYPTDNSGNIHVTMIRLEIEAYAKKEMIILA